MECLAGSLQHPCLIRPPDFVGNFTVDMQILGLINNADYLEKRSF